jgi:hypothetical protein
MPLFILTTYWEIIMVTHKTDIKDARKLAREVRKVANESKTTKYLPLEGPGGLCHYDKGACTNGSRGCIVGQAWRRVWKGEATLATVIASALFDLDDDGGWQILRWLDVVQEQQDQGATWGDAVASADKSSPWED